MKLKALLYLDEDFSKEIMPVLREEDVEVFDLFHGENLLEEISKGYLDILFFSCTCRSCKDEVTPTIKKIKQLDPRIEIICVGTREDDSHAIEAIKCGATACIGTPFDLIIFPGLACGDPQEIVIMEIKTGKNCQLSPVERKIRQLIEDGMVRYELYQPELKGTEEECL